MYRRSVDGDGFIVPQTVHPHIGPEKTWIVRVPAGALGQSSQQTHAHYLGTRRVSGYVYQRGYLSREVYTLQYMLQYYGTSRVSKFS